MRKPSFVCAQLVLLIVITNVSRAASPAWKAGLAEIKITPKGSLWMAGYAVRTRPSEGTSLELYAKALALQDQSGHRAVLVTTDLLGFPGGVSQNIARRVEKKYGLPRDRLLLNSSHTHSGPVVDRMLAVAYEGEHGMTAREWSAVERYTRTLEDEIVEVVGEALHGLQPAHLSFGHGEAGFAMNRRVKTARGYVIGEHWTGPVDHDVPVLRIERPGGKIMGVVFGYACHNTTIGGDAYQFNGDYAGYAQQWLESHHPGTIALFVQGCGADQNPYPRGTVELAEQHGEELAEAVEKTMDGSMPPARGPLKSAMRVFPVHFATPPTRQDLEAQLKDNDVYVRKHAVEMLKILKRNGHLPATYPYPVEVWQFGSDLTLIALGGECVVDYDLRLKKELGPGQLWVAGYSNDVFAYIPSLRVLQEGGYEAGGAMIYYVQPGPFAPSIEETIISQARQMVNGLETQSKSGTKK